MKNIDTLSGLTLFFIIIIINILHMEGLLAREYTIFILIIIIIFIPIILFFDNNN